MKKTFTLITLSTLCAMGWASFPESLKMPAYEEQVPDLYFDVNTRVDLGMTPVITDPEGKKVPYTRHITGMEWGDDYEEDMAVNIVFGDNDDVYICNLIGRDMSIIYGSYVKGEIIDGEIRVPVPQTVRSYGSWGQDITIMEKDATGEYVVSDIPYITYSYDKETGVIESQLPGEEKEYVIALAYSFDGSWNQTGDFTQVYYPYENGYNTMPEGLATEPYYLNDGYYGYPVEIGIQEDKLYMKGLSLDEPDVVVVGDIEGDIVKIPQNQMVGIMFGNFVWTKILLFDPVQELILAPENETYDMNFDRENKILSSVNPDNIFALNGKFDRVFYIEVFKNFILKTQDTFEGIPSDPYALTFDGDDFRETYGINGFNFNMSNISVEGNVLNINGLSYSIFIDGEKYEFEQYDGLNGVIYPGIETLTTQIPFLFSNDYDISYNSLVGRFIGIYPDGVSTIGVQVFYEYNNVVTYSQIVTLDVETGDISYEAGVKPLYSQDTEILSTEYFDLSGRKVTNPSNGIFIKRNLLSNGETVTSKVIKR